MNVQNFMSEAYQYVFEKRPFAFINKYYIVCTGRRILYDSVHEQWINTNLSYYRKYQAYHYENHDAEALSMLDTLEDLVNCEENKKLFIAEEEDEE